MWIAKNSITGKTYGKAFDSIYDCQSFINNTLVFLQYEWKQLVSMEKSYDNEVDYETFMGEHFKGNRSLVSDIFGRMEFALQSIVDSKRYDSVYGQNVIRCWYVEQKRFAEGMDF